MHEFSICQAIVDTVIAEAQKRDPVPSRIIATRIVVGKLRQLVPEYLQFAYENLTKDTIARGSTLAISTRPIIIRCKACGWEGEMEVIGFTCSECGGTNAEIIGGRELYLESLEIEEDEE